MSVTFNAAFDGDVGVWVATSDQRITVEGETRDALMQKLAEVVPDVLGRRCAPPGPIEIIVNWQALRTLDTTILAVA